MADAMPTITTNIHNWDGDVCNVCQTRVPKAKTQDNTPKPAINLLLLISRAFLKLAALTIAKITRKPALPIVEMLDKFTKLDKSKANPIVTNNPTSGRFQILSSRKAGSSPSVAIT